jgi:hypothetical protein
VLAAGAGLAAMPSPSSALSVQEALLLDVPAIALVSAEVKASATVNCGQGPITMSPRPFIEVGTGWFVDGRGYLITNTHVIDPAYRVPPWVAFDLKLRAVEEGCVNPALKARGLARGQRPDLEGRGSTISGRAAPDVPPGFGGAYPSDRADDEGGACDEQRGADYACDHRGARRRAARAG